MTDETKKEKAPNPFDPDSLRITGNINTVGAEKILLRLPVRKPNGQEFFRVRADHEYRLVCAILEIKDDREFYLVDPNVLPVLADEVRHVELRFCQNRQGAVFFWPVPMMGPDGRTNSWHSSAREAANFAETHWVRMKANMAEGGYETHSAIGKIPEPTWPEKTMTAFLELAFKDGKLIDSGDHPVVRQLRGI